jgi:Fe2+ or Zn2+ uptake regulation protein
MRGAPRLPDHVRATPQRRAVLAAIASRDGSFTATEIYDRARGTEPRLGLATVYRTLELLRRAGSVRQLAGAAYVRCHPGHHHHLVCLACGKVEDTELCGAPSPALLVQRHGFRAETHELDVYGVCARCA